MDSLTIFLRKYADELGLFLLLVWGFLLRVPFMTVLIRYDEAFTYLRYAQAPLTESLRDYHFPNNHLLHTILVHVSTGFLGGAEWAIRLPTFLAGLGTIVALYILMQGLYNKHVARLAAMLWASIAMSVEYATDARGYMLGTLLFLLMLCRPKWWVMALLGAAAIYTVPTMLYGFVLVMAWWLADIGRSNEPKKKQLIEWLGAGLLAGSLSMLLYLPIVLSDGIDIILNNPIIVKPTPEQFRAEFPDTLRETFRRWNRLMPMPIPLLLGMGFLVSPLAKSEKTTIWLPSATLAILPLIMIQQVLPFPRVWLFLLPLYVGFAALGWSVLWQKLPQNSLLILGIVLSMILGGQILQQENLYGVDEVAVLPQAEAIRADLLTRLNTDSRLVVVLPSEVILEYYFQRHQHSDLYADQTRSQFRRTLYILVNHAFEDQTLADVFSGVAGYGEPELIQTFEDASLYQSVWDESNTSLEAQMVAEWEDLAGKVFNPRTNPKDLMSFIGITETDFSKAELEAIEAWRKTKEARLLSEADIHFLLVDGEWLGWLSEAEYNQFADSTQYLIRHEWREEETGQFFRLYEVLWASSLGEN